MRWRRPAPPRSEDACLRLKAPSTLTMRWLPARPPLFRLGNPDSEVQLTSAWMDVTRRLPPRTLTAPCCWAMATFPEEGQRAAVEEWLIPACAAEAVQDGPWDPARLRRRTAAPDPGSPRLAPVAAGHRPEDRVPPSKGGQLFDMLELASSPPHAATGCRSAICCWSPRTSMPGAWVYPANRRVQRLQLLPGVAEDASRAGAPRRLRDLLAEVAQMRLPPSSASCRVRKNNGP